MPGEAGGEGAAAQPDARADDDGDWTNDAGLNAMARELGVLDGTKARGAKGQKVGPLHLKCLFQDS